MTFEYQCSPYYRQSALHPVIDHLQRLFAPADSPADKLIKLERTFEPYNLPPERVVPLVAGLLSLPLPEGRYPPLNMSPQRQRQMTQQVVVDCFLDASERRALLLIWEDLQWADPTTLELLRLLIVQAPTARLLLLLTFRSDFRPPWPVRSHQNHLTLGRLTRPQAEELIAMVSGGQALAAEVLEQLVKRADGVPLFVEELAKMVLDCEPAGESGESSELAGRLPPLAIPATLQDSLMARLDRFPTMREIAQLASALGREFTYGWLRAVSSMDEAALQEGLAQLVDAELFYQRGVPPGSRYTFKHMLIQEAAYRSLLRRTRKQYHEKIARALEEGFPEIAETQPELLAYQFTEAELIEQAVDYWHRAGVKAARQSAYAEATSHLTRGLELLARLPEGAPRNHRELMLKMSLGESMIFLRGPAATQVEQVFFRAWQLCQDPADPAAQQSQVSNLSFSALALWLLGHPDQACKRYLEAHSLAQERSHPGSIVEALSYAAMICQCRREPRATREWAEAASKLAHEQGFPHFAAMSVVLLGWADVQEGQAGKGIDEMRRGLTSWRSSGFRGLMTYILALLAGACGQVGEQGEGLAAVAEGLDLAHETGERTWDAELLRLRGELLGRSEAPAARVEACFQQALDVARRQGAKSLELRAARSLAGLWRNLDKVNDARSLLEVVYRQLVESSDTVDLREATTLLEELRR